MAKRRQLLQGVLGAGAAAGLSGCFGLLGSNDNAEQFSYGDFEFTLQSIDTTTAIAYDVETPTPKIYPRSSDVDGMSPVLAILRLEMENTGGESQTLQARRLIGENCRVVGLAEQVESQAANEQIEGNELLGQELGAGESTTGWLMLRIPGDNLDQSVYLKRYISEDEQETLFEITPDEMQASAVRFSNLELTPHTDGTIDYALTVQHEGVGDTELVALLQLRGAGELDQRTVISETVADEDGEQTFDGTIQTRVTGPRRFLLRPFEHMDSVDIPPMELEEGEEVTDVSGSTFQVTNMGIVDELTYSAYGEEETVTGPQGWRYALGRVQVELGEGVTAPPPADNWTILNPDGEQVDARNIYRFYEIDAPYPEVVSPVRGNLYPTSAGMEERNLRGGIDAYVVFLVPPMDDFKLQLTRRVAGNNFMVRWE